MNGTPSETQFLNPERIVGYFGLNKRMTVADFGAGSGFYTIPAARAVGEEGKVFAIDIQRSALDIIKSKAGLLHLLNIETVWADLELPEGSLLPAASVDFVVISNILFQAEKKLEIFQEAARVAKRGAEVATVEWDETPFPGGPPVEMRVPKSTVKALAGQVGLVLDKEFEAGSHHYGLLYRKP